MLSRTFLTIERLEEQARDAYQEYHVGAWTAERALETVMRQLAYALERAQGDVDNGD